MPRKAIVPREATPSATPTQQSQDGTAVLREAASEAGIAIIAAPTPAAPSRNQPMSSTAR